MEWLHQGSAIVYSDLSADFLSFGAGGSPFKTPFTKCFKIVLFFPLGPSPGFGAAISGAAVRSFFVFCNAVSADRAVVAASRFLAAAAASVIRLVFAAESRELEWSGCIKVAMVICKQIEKLVVFLFILFSKISFKKRFKIVLFSLWRFLELQFLFSWSASHLLCVKTSLCKRLLCVKDFVCQSLLCVKAFCVSQLAVCKSSLCKSFFLLQLLCVIESFSLSL